MDTTSKIAIFLALAASLFRLWQSIANANKKLESTNLSGGDSSLTASNGMALEKYIQKVNASNLDKTAEYYLDRGVEFIRTIEFDDAILEFVKAIRTSSSQETTHQSAKNQLKELGFSEADISHIGQ